MPPTFIKFDKILQENTHSSYFHTTKNSFTQLKNCIAQLSTYIEISTLSQSPISIYTSPYFSYIQISPLYITLSLYPTLFYPFIKISLILDCINVKFLTLNFREILYENSISFNKIL